MINAYDCTTCQTMHTEQDEDYTRHILKQSKHGLYKVDPCFVDPELTRPPVTHPEIHMPYPKPALTSGNFGVISGHPDITLSPEDAARLERPNIYGWMIIHYTDEKRARMWLEKTASGIYTAR